MTAAAASTASGPAADTSIRCPGRPRRIAWLPPASALPGGPLVGGPPGAYIYDFLIGEQLETPAPAAPPGPAIEQD
jgi:hypothetical protein